MSEVVSLPKAAAAVPFEGSVAAFQVSESQTGKCLRVPQRKVPEVESRVANLISVFSVRAQEDASLVGGLGPRRSSTGERNLYRREKSQPDGSPEAVRRSRAETSQSPPKKEEKTPRDPQCSPTKIAAVPSCNQVATKEEETPLTPESVVQSSPLGKWKTSKLDSNPFIQNDQKKLVEFGSPIKGGLGGFRRSQKNTAAVTYVEDVQEHTQAVSKDSVTTDSQQQQQQCSESQRSNNSPCQKEHSTPSPDFPRKTRASSCSPVSQRRDPVTPKVQGDVWCVSLIPQQSITEPTSAPDNPCASTEAQVEPNHLTLPPPTSLHGEQEDHTYDDVIVPGTVIHQDQGRNDGFTVIPVGTLPLSSKPGHTEEEEEEEVCSIIVPFHDCTPMDPPRIGKGSLQQPQLCVELAYGTPTDMSVSLSQEEQEDLNESFEVVDFKDAGSEEDLTRSPRSEKKLKWKLFGKKKKKKSESGEDEEQRRKKAAIKKRGSIPRTAIKLKSADEESFDNVGTSGDAGQGEQEDGIHSEDCRREAASFPDGGGASPLEQSEDGSSVSETVSEASQKGAHAAAGSAPHLVAGRRESSRPSVSKSDRKDKTISREIYDIIVNGFDASKGNHLGDVTEQEEGGAQYLAVPSATSPQDSSRAVSDESSSESEPDDSNNNRDTRSEGSPMHESPSGELAPRRRSSIMENSDAVETTPLMYADALWDHVGIKPGELSFKVGNVIGILNMTDEVMWQGTIGERTGWFQASFVRLRIAQGEDEDGQGPQTKLPGDQVKTDAVKQPPVKDGVVRRALTIRRKDGSNAEPKKLSPLEVRAKIVEEILNSERDYVNHLRDIVEGYLQRCTEHTKLFTSEKIELIFGNVQNIYKFQKDFLKELETRVNRDKMEDSQIGDIFVANASEFTIYSEYCNNHPHAVHEMNLLQLDDQYAFFFESCRLLQNLQDISLEGYLLTPVQKICKYPLQLSELLKYTSEDHPDHRHVKVAQEVMKGVAMLINEQKRRMENAGKIGQWQETITDWKGEDILETSTELIYSGELHKISKGHSQERHFFLFDHQIVYCKKDAIGGKLTYKGRLCVDNCDIIDLQDGVVVYGGTAIKYAWKMNNRDKDKWYVLYAKTAVLKKEWMEAFQAERERVREDNEKGFHISLKMKKSAVALCNATTASRYRRKSFQKKNAITESLESSTPRKIVSTRSKSGKKGAVIGSPVALKKSIS